MLLCRTITLTLCLLVVAAPTLAYDLGKVQINGFVSQGYIQSDGNNVFTADSMEGTFQFNEFGLTVNSDVTDKLHIGAQFLARDLGDEGNNELKLDWGYGDYRFADWFGVRAGKIKLPIGLYNEGRDTDLLRPMVFLPQSLYDEMRRDIANAAVGGGIHGYVPAGKAGSILYNAVYGEIDIADDSFMNEFFRYWINTDLLSPYFGGPWLEELSYDSDYIAVGSLIYNTPVEGLRLGFTGMATEGEFTSKFNATFDPGAVGLTDTSIQLKLQNYYIASLEYSTPVVTISAEAFRLNRTITIFGNLYKKSVTESGGYLMASVPLPFAPGFSINGVYDLYFDDLENRKWQTSTKDIGIGLRFDPDEHWTIKAEYHDCLGAGRTYTYFNPVGEVKDWSYWLLKTSFNF